MQIKDDPSLKWLEKMKGDPNKRIRNKFCCFRRDHGHDTNECFDLKQQIENLIRQGKLRNFLGRDYKDEKLKAKVEESSRPSLGEIRMIVGGGSTSQSSRTRKTYLKVVQNVQLSGRSPKTSRQSLSQTRMPQEYIILMTMPSLLPCSSLITQLEGCWQITEVWRTSCIILPSNK